jgi:hypothetical protein
MNTVCYHTTESKRNSKQGSILLVVILVLMIIMALLAVVITGILSRQRSYLSYLNKKKTFYLAESANAMARSYLRDEQKFRLWQNMDSLPLEDGIINATITPLDEHLWQIETAARDNARTSYASISNIVRPEFDYVVFSEGSITGSGSAIMKVSGNIRITQNIMEKQLRYMQKSGSIIVFSSNISSPEMRFHDQPFPGIDTRYFNNADLIPANTVHRVNGDFIVAGKEQQPVSITGIYVVTGNIRLKHVIVHGSIISLNGTIFLGEQCSIIAQQHYPALASLNGSIVLEGTRNHHTIEGLVYTNSLSVQGSADISGAVYSRDGLAINNLSPAPVTLVLRFNETVLQTQGLHFAWRKLKNLSWNEK